MIGKVRATWPWFVGVVCTYEVCALSSGRTPTVSTLCQRYPWLAPVIVAGLAVHLKPQPTGAVDA